MYNLGRHKLSLLQKEISVAHQEIIPCCGKQPTGPGLSCMQSSGLRIRYAFHQGRARLASGRYCWSQLLGVWEGAGKEKGLISVPCVHCSLSTLLRSIVLITSHPPSPLRFLWFPFLTPHPAPSPTNPTPQPLPVPSAPPSPAPHLPHVPPALPQRLLALRERQPSALPQLQQRLFVRRQRRGGGAEPPQRGPQPDLGGGNPVRRRQAA